jgi:hypothetical protein
MKQKNPPRNMGMPYPEGPVADGDHPDEEKQDSQNLHG